MLMFIKNVNVYKKPPTVLKVKEHTSYTMKKCLRIWNGKYAWDLTKITRIKSYPSPLPFSAAEPYSNQF